MSQASNILGITAVEKSETPEKPPTMTFHSGTLVKDYQSTANSKFKSLEIDEHLLNAEQVASLHNANINVSKPADSNGLSTDDAQKRVLEGGQNVLTPQKKIHPILKYLQCLCGLFNLLLIAAAIFEYAVLAVEFEANKVNIYLGAVLFAVAFLNAYIEFYQLRKSAAILESFLNLSPQKCLVRRDGKWTQILAVNLVCGDVVFVKMGDKVPADLYLFAATDMKVDNSSLTGETGPQKRTTFDFEKNPLKATNLCFSGTLVISGEGYGIVIRTGDTTVLGQIANLTFREKKNKSPLAREIDDLVKIISGLATLSVIVFFFCSLKIYNNNIALSLNFAISLLVAWAPQGLPATVMMLLTVAAKRMGKRNVLVKDLQSVETLGAITLLAIDKAGTLTGNGMVPSYIWSDSKLYTTFKHQNESAEPFDPKDAGNQEIILTSILCSRINPFSEREIRFASQYVPDYDEVVNAYPKIFEIPLIAANKWALSIHKKRHENGELILYMQGAPERVLLHCSTIFLGGVAVPLTDEHRKQFHDVYEFMASKGHRVLAFSRLPLPGSQYSVNYSFTRDEIDNILGNLCFLGLVSLEDPPKHGVREAMGRCRLAGIRVVMITGDGLLTAEDIARNINLMLSDTKALVAKRTGRPVDSIREEEYDAVVISGETIDTLSDFEWDNIFSKCEIVFARTSPRHKLEIVKRAQNMGHIVGVTGDGVNDAPALKKADLGISMNNSGSDVSKEAASMILLDDNFASTIKGIEEGRLIFINLKKSVQYVITHLTPEIYAVLLFIIVPLPLPLSTIQILLIDLGYELFIAMTFAWDKPEDASKLMKLAPRRRVTPKTIQNLRHRALMRTPTVTDPETGLPLQTSRMSRFFTQFKKLASWEWWKQRFELSGDGEVLIDGNILSYAYLEVGILETVFCLLAYFIVLNHHGISPTDARLMQLNGSYFLSSSPDYTTTRGVSLTADQQVEALSQGQSIFYLSIMIQQMFDLFAVKDRFDLPFGKFMFSNPRNFIGIFLGGCLAMFVVYIPPANTALGSNYRLSPLYWLTPIGGGITILLYVSVRILVFRRRRASLISEVIAGLSIMPDIYSLDLSV